MAYAGQIIRLFISSTFNDLHPERNALQETVFPKLRDFCRLHGARFQAIDLRWGVSQEASNDQRTLAICYEEIRRCRAVSPHVNFFVLLGERYGSSILPEQIAASEFEALLAQLDATEQHLLTVWYRLDTNPLDIQGRPAPVYVLQPREGEYTLYQRWEQVQQQLHECFVTACRKGSLDPASQMKYLASATELEVAEGVFQYSPAEQEALCFFRTISGIPQGNLAATYIERDPARQARLAKLKQRLRDRAPHAVFDYTARWGTNEPTADHLANFCDLVYARLWERIEAALKQDAPEAIGDADAKAYSDFARERSRYFVGREDVLAAIARYLARTDHYPFVITGLSGSGKSALLARAVEDARKMHPEAEVQEVYIGVTPDSANTRTLLESICRRITVAYGGDETTVPTDEKGLIQELPQRLELATKDRPLLLFIDALDQLRDSGQRAIWVPMNLPEHVHLVISTLPGSGLETLKRYLPPSQMVTLSPMTRGQGEHLLNQWLEQEAKRTLQPEQREAVLQAFAPNGLPLYLRLAYEDARLWPSYRTVPTLKPDIPGIIRDLFQRLSSLPNHGEVLVSHALGYLAAARNGLSEDEILDVLSLDQQVLDDVVHRSPFAPKVRRFPVVLWSRLYFDLLPYLTERKADETNLINFFHQQFSEMVEAKYLLAEDGTTRSLSEALTRHRSLAHYFMSQPLANGDVPNLRKLTEQPYQQTLSEMWDEVYETLTDFRFLEQKVSTGPIERRGPSGNTMRVYNGVYDLQEDFNRAEVAMPRE
jgi:NACHT domain- and WD repeat-containing protein